MMKYNHLSVFDLDHTLVQGNSSSAFCLYLFRSKVISLSHLLYSLGYYVRHDLGGMSLQALHEKIFNRVLVGRSQSLLEDRVEPFLERYLPEALYMPAIDALRLAQHMGHYTLILSSSPDFLIRSIAQYLGINSWKGTEYAVDKDKKICHIAAIMEANLKVEYVLKLRQELNVNQENTTIYSDSYLDLPFLQAAGTPIAVNPDKQLLKHAKEYNWAII